MIAPEVTRRCPADTRAVRILVRGHVQGVGFRPFVQRLASAHCLSGRVYNSAEGVVIEASGAEEALDRFQADLKSLAPPAACIVQLVTTPAGPSGAEGFRIDPSRGAGDRTARVPPDLATCSSCQEDVVNPSSRRRGYSFTTCTACGPRYSILEAMPYDRPATSMRSFVMCADCGAEYVSPEDRRFHAQPNACWICGPQVGLWGPAGETIARSDEAIARAAEVLKRGEILAVKGLGGFQLLARADSADVVARLRTRKGRPSKPFAVMVASLAAAEGLVRMDAQERRLLGSRQNPIVVAEHRPGSVVDGIAPGVSTLGVMLPTTPLHHLLLDELPFPVIATSGNRGDEPIVTDERDVVRSLGGIADAFLVHNRPIVRRVDDSVVRVIAGSAVTLRLARGYAPAPLPALEELARRIAAPPLLAAGTHERAAVAFWSGTQAILAQHIGDLDHPAARTAFEEIVTDVTELYGFTPAGLACDLHPDYFTTRWAEGQGKPLVRVQHHHAHALAAMAEHHLLDREVLACCWDGTGYGLDGRVWGGEILRVRGSTFTRVASLLPFPLPGGEAAIRHPNRAAFGLLHGLLGDHPGSEEGWACQLGITPRERRFLVGAIRRGVHTPWTTSVGRLFDAVAALVLGIHEVSYEGEAAARLEAAADPQETGAYDIELRRPSDAETPSWWGDWRLLARAVLDDLRRGVDTGAIAGRFHNALARWAASVALREPWAEVVLGGGCFQNRLLTERTLESLREAGRHAFAPGWIPPGDGGLAVGQLAAALIAEPHEKTRR